MGNPDTPFPLSDAESIRGVYVYEAEDAGEYIAYHRLADLSTTADTKAKAIEQCREAVDEYYDGQRTHWDMWAMDCPECDGGLLEPLKSAVDDPQDTRVQCHQCGAARTLFALPRDRSIRTCPTCDDSVPLEMESMTEPFVCPECETSYHIQEVTYLEKVDK